MQWVVPAIKGVEPDLESGFLRPFGAISAVSEVHYGLRVGGLCRAAAPPVATIRGP